MAAGINLIGFIKEIGDKKKISYDVVAQNFKEALLKTHEKLYPEAILDVVIDVDKGKFTMAEKFEIIADDIEEYDDYIQMPLAEAKRIDAAAKIGGTLLIPFKPNTTYLNEILKNFKHNNTSEQNKYIYNNSKDKVGQVLYLRVESYSHDLATVELDDTFVTVDKEELIPGEKLQVGSKYYFYVKKVDEKLKSNPVILSRSDSNLVLYLLKKEIPEIEDGVIVIKKIARVAGERTKIAVTCNDNNIDPIGTIIGPKGNRINRVKDAINKERIEIIRWNDDINKFILNVFAPIEISYFLIENKENEYRKITVVCDNDKQLIGKFGNNIRIANQLLDASVEVITNQELQDSDEVNQYTKADYVANPIDTAPRGPGKFAGGRGFSGGNRGRRPIHQTSSQTNSVDKENRKKEIDEYKISFDFDND